jgi:hypothetical protein
MDNASILASIQKGNAANSAAGPNLAPPAVGTGFTMPAQAPVQQQAAPVATVTKPKHGFVMPTLEQLGGMSTYVGMAQLTAPTLVFTHPNSKAFYPKIVAKLGAVPTNTPVIVYPDDNVVQLSPSFNMVVLHFVQFWAEYNNNGDAVNWVFDATASEKREMDETVYVVALVWKDQNTLLPCRVELKRGRCACISDMVKFVDMNKLNNTKGVVLTYSEIEKASKTPGGNNFALSKGVCQSVPGLDGFVDGFVNQNKEAIQSLITEMYNRLPGGK